MAYENTDFHNFWLRVFTLFSSSSEKNLLNQVMDVIQMSNGWKGTTSNSYFTSQNESNLFIMLAKSTAVNIPAVVVVDQIVTTKNYTISRFNA